MLLNIPSQIVVGDHVAWISRDIFITDAQGKAITLDPAVDTLTWKFGKEGYKFQITSTQLNSDFLTILDNATTQSLIAGDYYYHIYATVENYTKFIFAGTLKVIAEISDTTDARTSTQKLLDAVNAAIQTILDGGAVQSYSIKGRNLARMSISELMSLRDQLKVELSREKAGESLAQGLGDSRKLYVRFR
jgi:hypothetical protein